MMRAPTIGTIMYLRVIEMSFEGYYTIIILGTLLKTRVLQNRFGRLSTMGRNRDIASTQKNSLFTKILEDKQ